MTNDLNKQKRIQRAQDLHYYPLALNVKEKDALVVGGGKVAVMKVKGLLAAGAKVILVSPDLTDELRGLLSEGKITYVERTVSAEDLDGVAVVIAATSSPEVNENVCRWARERKILINVVDQPDLCDFICPAVCRKEEAIVCVYTNGAAPSLSRDLKNFIDHNWDKIRK